MPDRTHAPATEPEFHITIPRAETQVSGTTAYHWIVAGNQPVVRIEIVFRQGGSIHDTHPGQGFLTNKMLLHGTSRMTTADIAEGLDMYGAFVRLSPSFDDPSIELYCLTKHLDSVLPLLSDMVSDSVFPDDEFELVRRIAIENLQVQNARNNIVATKIFRHRIFGPEHPYGHILTEEDLKSLKSSQLRSFYHERLSQFEVIVSGNYTLSDREKIMNHLVSGKGQKDLPLRVSANSERGAFYDNKEASLQTSLRLGHLMPGKGHKEYPKLRVCLHALGGYFGSRLMKNIREDKGYTYGIYASMVSLVHDNYLTIGADVQKKFREEAISEIYKEIGILQQENLSEDEIAMVRNHILGSFQSELDSPFSLAGKFKSVYFYGLDYDYYDRFIDTVKNISADDIRNMAVKYLQTADFTEVSVG